MNFIYFLCIFSKNVSKESNFKQQLIENILNKFKEQNKVMNEIKSKLSKSEELLKKEKELNKYLTESENTLEDIQSIASDNQ